MPRNRFTYSPKEAAVLLLALAALFIPLAYFIYGVLKHTGGVFMYPVDDAFIHMELARNLAFHGTWGINPGEFGSASSSVLYTLLLSLLFRLFSDHTLIPLIVNAVAAILLLAAIQRWLMRHNMRPGVQLLILLMVVFFVPLPTLIMSGMEHTLQCLFSFLFVFHFADWYERITDDRQPITEGRTTDEGRPVTEGKRRGGLMPFTLLLYALLTASIRYEGLFLVFPACLLLLWRRRFAAAVWLGFWALLPVLLFGIFSVSKGSYILPNSLLVKSESLHLSVGGVMRYVENILVNKFTIAGKEGITLQATQRLLAILPLAWLVFSRQMRENRSWRTILLVLTGGVVLHLALAGTGKFYRYEAYLVLCSVVIVSAILFRYRKEALGGRSLAVYALAAVLLFFLFFPILLRTTAALSKVKQACINIYEQQYQMGKFFQRSYPADALAANDIGAVSFYTRGYIFDLWGLGNIEVARSKKGGYWTSGFLQGQAGQKGVKVAALYDSWLQSSLPAGWIKVATWQIHNNVVCGDDTVSFYAADATQADTLKRNLQSYQPSLPSGVKVQYY
jgi:hypothetical protein